MSQQDESSDINQIKKSIKIISDTNLYTKRYLGFNRRSLSHPHTRTHFTSQGKNIVKVGLKYDYKNYNIKLFCNFSSVIFLSSLFPLITKLFNDYFLQRCTLFLSFFFLKFFFC